MVVVIKKWFAEKIDTPYGFGVWNRELTVEKETEKAYYGTIEVDSVDGEYEKTIHVWVPKKCTMTIAEARAEDLPWEPVRPWQRPPGWLPALPVPWPDRFWGTGHHRR